MSAEEWEQSRYIVALCPRCRNQTPQSELEWSSKEDYEAYRDEQGEVDYIPMTLYWHFTQCVTCEGASVYESTDINDENWSRVWPAVETPSAPPIPPEQRHLAAAADLLAARGRTRAAALLLECVGIAYRLVDVGYRGEDRADLVMAVLLVRPPYVDSFDQDVSAEIAGALTEASLADGSIVREVTVVAVAEDGDWRERVERTLGIAETNTAALFPAKAKRHTANGLTFGSPEEIVVWEELKRMQAELPRTETIGIIPNCAFQVANGSKFSPDFIVTYKGRAGTIGVDGPHHSGRFAADRQKDELACDAGIAYAYRIPVEDVSVPEELRAHIDRFLKRLAS